LIANKSLYRQPYRPALSILLC